MSNVTSRPGRSLRLSSGCDLSAVREVARMVRAFLERHGVTPLEADAWELVCSEAGNNAVEHATEAALRQTVEFEVEVDPSMVELRVIDHTAGFDLPEQSELPNPLDEGGRGMFLMQSLSDSLRYFRGRDENCLVVRRRRVPDIAKPAGPPAPADEGNSIEHEMMESTLQTMTEELAASYESLSAIFRFTEDLNRSGGDTEFIDRWLIELKQITEADWYVLRLLDESRGHLVVAKTSHPELSLAPLPFDPVGTHLKKHLSVELASIQGHQDVWYDEADPPSDADPLRAISATLAGLSHPLFVADELAGVLSVGRYTRGHPFTAGQVNIIHTLSDFLGIQIRNAHFQRASLQAQLLERDYEVASRIQRQLLPKRHPTIGPWSTVGLCESAQRVGGDFYDIIEVGSQGLLLAVADVMGKGLPAALFATVFRTLLHARPEMARSPGAFVEWLNQNLVTELGELEMFITAQLAYVNFSSRELRVAGAGHPPLLIAGRDQDTVQVLSCGPPLGISSHMEFHEERLTLPTGTRLLLYTDGVSEATDPEGHQLGMDPLMEILRTSAKDDEAPEETLRRFRQLENRVANNGMAADDRTLLLLQENLGQD